MVRLPLIVLAALLAAGPALAQKIPAGQLPAEVAAAARTAMPQMTLTQAELKEREGRRYYDVEGTLPDGSEIELDLLQGPSGWSVVEIQRDIPWSAAPAKVRAATPRGVNPVRVIESRQMDGAVVYELFAAGQPKDPAMEVMWKGGEAKVLTERWQH